MHNATKLSKLDFGALWIQRATWAILEWFGIKIRWQHPYYGHSSTSFSQGQIYHVAVSTFSWYFLYPWLAQLQFHSKCFRLYSCHKHADAYGGVQLEIRQTGQPWLFWAEVNTNRSFLLLFHAIAPLEATLRLQLALLLRYDFFRHIPERNDAPSFEASVFTYLQGPFFCTYSWSSAKVLLISISRYCFEAFFLFLCFSEKSLQLKSPSYLTDRVLLLVKFDKHCS